MLKRIVSIILISFGISYGATPPCFNPISTIDWSFFVDALEFKGVCSCSTSGSVKVGIKMQVAEPIAFIETPNKAWNFLCFGGTRSNASVDKKDGTNLGSKGAKTNVHYIKYPVFAVLNIAMDYLCVEKKNLWSDSFDIIPTGLSEVNPLIWDDELSILTQPWKLLLASPPAQVLCLADCIASSTVSSSDVSRAESIRNSLFWCGGCWGAIAPDTTTTRGKDSIVESALTATKIIDVLHQSLQLKVFKETSGLDWAGSIANYELPTDVACMPKFFPVIVKSQYWLNLSYPVAWDAIPIGDFAPKWAWFKKYPGKEENIWTIWRVRTCCMGFQVP